MLTGACNQCDLFRFKSINKYYETEARRTKIKWNPRQLLYDGAIVSPSYSRIIKCSISATICLASLLSKLSHNVAYRPVTRQRPRNKERDNSRCYAAAR
jgi:hypothetical protein